MTLKRESIAEAQLLGLLAGDPNTFTPAQWTQLAAGAQRLLDLLDENPGPGDERQRRLCGGSRTRPPTTTRQRCTWRYGTS